jgi:hypothetical protein
MKMNVTFKKKLILTFLFISSFCGLAQNLQWVKDVGGTASDIGTSVVTDALGNVYFTGVFSGPADFDPGPSTATLNSVTSADAYIVKLDSLGNFIWAKAFGGNISGLPSLGLDANGNIYASGSFAGSFDFDPGSNVATMTSLLLTKDVFILKLDNAGNLVWVTHFGGQGSDECYGIAVSSSGNVHTVGSYEMVVDFDPGLGTYTLGATYTDVFVSKLDANGNFLWCAGMGGNLFEEGFSISLDASGNVYSTGYFSGTADFDPGSLTYNLSVNNSTGQFISKLNSSGNFVWAKNVSGSGNVFGISISLDAAGNIYNTGTFDGAVDFDPGPSTNTLSPVLGSSDVFVSKLDGSGNLMWIKNFAGAGNGFGSCVKADAQGNVYTTGSFDSPTDFDPGAGTYTFSTNSLRDIFFSKLDNLGNFVSARKMGGNFDDRAQSLSINTSGDIYLTGSFNDVANFATSAATHTLGSMGSEDVFILKLGSCPSSLGPINGQVSFCEKGFPLSYSISPVSGASGYIWSVSPSVPINSGQNTTSTSITFSPGTYTIAVKAANSCGNGSQDSLVVNVLNNPALTITTDNTLVCVGESRTLTASGAVTSFTWGTAEHSQFIVVSPTINTSYFVVASASNGCKSTATVNLKISFCAGIENESLENQETIYPNPANSFCIIKTNEGATIKLFDINAKEIKNINYLREGEEYRLNLSNVEAGIYFIEIVSGKMTLRKKLVVNPE